MDEVVYNIQPTLISRILKYGAGAILTGTGIGFMMSYVYNKPAISDKIKDEDRKNVLKVGATLAFAGAGIFLIEQHYMKITAVSKIDLVKRALNTWFDGYDGWLYYTTWWATNIILENRTSNVVLVSDGKISSQKQLEDCAKKFPNKDQFVECAIKIYEAKK